MRGFARATISTGTVNAVTWYAAYLSVSYTTWNSTNVVDVYMDAAEFGLNGVNMTNSTFRGFSLPPPVLNISALSLIKLDDKVGRPNRDYRNEDFRVPLDSSALVWAYDNHTYNLDYLERSGSCQAVSVRESRK